MSIAPETRARLEQLAQTWRTFAKVADEHSFEIAATFEQCSDELAELLSSLEPPQAQEPQCIGPHGDAFDCPVHNPRKFAEPTNG